MWKTERIGGRENNEKIERRKGRQREEMKDRVKKGKTERRGRQREEVE
jgi:hypothetical protein